MRIIKRNIEELNPAKYNPRKDLKPGDKQFEYIKNSISTFGYIDPIIVNIRDDKNIIVGGHQRYKVLKDLGYTEIDIVEVDMGEEEEKACNVALNKTGGDWDLEKLSELVEELKETEFNMDQFGLDLEELEKELKEKVEEVETEEIEEKEENNDDTYTAKIEVPQYEITGAQPELSELVNTEKTMELIEEINNSNITDEQKEFLIKAAQRHNVFNYKNIAEYYAHQEKEIQELMEKSALVIIDFDDAIKNGYVRLTKEIEKMRTEEE